MIKYHNDISFRILTNLRGRLWKSIQGITKAGTTKELVGCPQEYLLKYLESQFDDEMSWSNYGLNGWEIDHKIPCNSFNFENEEEQRECFHYSNLQPLWDKINRSKGDRLT